MYISRNQDETYITLWLHKPVKYEAANVSRWVGWRADSFVGRLCPEDVTHLDLKDWDGSPIEVEIRIKPLPV